MDGWVSLANAIITITAHDYKSALRAVRRNPYNYVSKKNKNECELFFRSGLFEAISNVDGEYLIRRLQEDVDREPSRRRR